MIGVKKSSKESIAKYWTKYGLAILKYILLDLEASIPSNQVKS